VVSLVAINGKEMTEAVYKNFIAIYV